MKKALLVICSLFFNYFVYAQNYSATEVINKSKAAYGTIQTYFDSGKVVSSFYNNSRPHSNAKYFKTSYSSNGLFNFEYYVLGQSNSLYVINQFLQIINFSLFGYGFKYISGLFFTIETDIARSFNFELKWGTSSWEFLFNNDNGEKVISINLVAIFLVVLIDKLIRKNASAVWPNKLTEIGPTP